MQTDANGMLACMDAPEASCIETRAHTLRPTPHIHAQTDANGTLVYTCVDAPEASCIEACAIGSVADANAACAAQSAVGGRNEYADGGGRQTVGRDAWRGVSGWMGGWRGVSGWMDGWRKAGGGGWTDG
eukprot:358605-Chlamydomonas_euryale.AAC.6